MTKLLDLKEKILSIPGKRQRQDLVGRLRLFNEKAQKASGVLTTDISGRRWAHQVFSEEISSGPSEKAQQAARSAGTLLRKLAKDQSFIEKSNAGNSLDNINMLVHSSYGTLKGQWKNAITVKTEGFVGLVDAAKEAKLEGSENLDSLLSWITGQVNAPPASEEQASAIKGKLDSLVKGIAALELEGEGGKFLIEAANGSADARSLFRPEVEQFITKFNLWRLLRVRLG
jgi:hypothetical protein